jgi:hypothetical protein
MDGNMTLYSILPPMVLGGLALIEQPPKLFMPGQAALPSETGLIRQPWRPQRPPDRPWADP